MKIINFIKKIGKKIKEFIIDEHGGNLVEYILLIGFALFIFFILVVEVTGILNWTVGLSNDLMENVGD